MKPERDPEATLCFPDSAKSCFACCPPIRPAGYEHIQYRRSIERVLRENTEQFHKKSGGMSPITGFSCWALGYVNGGYRQVGCLLHPAVNAGEDLRYRVDYGGKCAREVCPEARVLLELDRQQRAWWLHLADGLDSFAYSSRRENPLFRLLPWGSELLAMAADGANDNRIPGRDRFWDVYPFFRTRLNPRANGYLLTRIVAGEGIDVLKKEEFRVRFEGFSRTLIGNMKAALSPSGAEVLAVSRLDVAPQFRNFLRLSLGVRTISLREALRLKRRTDAAVDLLDPGVR